MFDDVHYQPVVLIPEFAVAQILKRYEGCVSIPRED